MWVYIAHPCLTDDQKDFKNQFIVKLKDQLTKTDHGRLITLIDPFDHFPHVEGSMQARETLGRELVETYIDFLAKSEVLIAVVGDEDAATAFAAGYAYRLGIPIVLVSKDECSSAHPLLTGTCSARFDDILDDMQISLLVALLEWFYLQNVHGAATPDKES